ncbi:MAG: hypothetical protein LUC39_04120 [Clostridiales bacterium]|nr:hypothetical protein [Clostridiales bacterium]
MTRAEALKYRAAIETAVQSLDDETAAEVPALFPAWTEGAAYESGMRVQYGGTVYAVLQAHTSQSDWTPENAPSLFAEVLPGQGGSEVGEWVQPESTNGYMTGDRVVYNGTVYESLIDNNVWSPEAYPEGWQAITEEGAEP